MHVKKNNLNFTNWFVGFSEGNGHWDVIKDKNYCRVTFLINQKNPQVLYCIKKFFGFGIVKGPFKDKTLGSYYFQYYVSGQDHIKVLLETINGKLIFQKSKDTFEECVTAYNSLSAVQSTLIQVFPKNNNNLPSYNNSWLSGFVDASGCFSGHVKSDWSAITLQFSFIKRCDETQIFEHLRILMGGSLGHVKGSHSYLIVVGESAIQELIKYLEKYKLRSDKNVPFVRFKKVHVRLTSPDFQWSSLGRRAQQRLKTLVTNLNMHFEKN
jgi:hypothetical protein